MVRQLTAEALGSLLLATIVIGSGIMAERLAGGNAGLALLANSGSSFGLLLVILGNSRDRNLAWQVAAWIGAAYWFSSSTSFANPAITLARSLSDTFTGIRPTDLAPFIVARIAGAFAALGLWQRVLAPQQQRLTPAP